VASIVGRSSFPKDKNLDRAGVAMIRNDWCQDIKNIVIPVTEELIRDCLALDYPHRTSFTEVLQQSKTMKCHLSWTMGQFVMLNRNLGSRIRNQYMGSHFVNKLNQQILIPNTFCNARAGESTVTCHPTLRTWSDNSCLKIGNRSNKVENRDGKVFQSHQNVLVPHSDEEPKKRARNRRY
jgi:hypothetical protein